MSCFNGLKDYLNRLNSELLVLKATKIQIQGRSTTKEFKTHLRIQVDWFYNSVQNKRWLTAPSPLTHYWDLIRSHKTLDFEFSLLFAAEVGWEHFHEYSSKWIIITFVINMTFSLNKAKLDKMFDNHRLLIFIKAFLFSYISFTSSGSPSWSV